MAKRQAYEVEIEFYIAGIPCLIGVTYYAYKAANPYSWDSDVDFRGYEEIDFDILDRKGYKAPWLERKLNDPKVKDCPHTAVAEFFAEMRRADKEDYDWDYYAQPF